MTLNVIPSLPNNDNNKHKGDSKRITKLKLKRKTRNDNRKEIGKKKLVSEKRLKKKKTERHELRHKGSWRHRVLCASSSRKTEFT